MYVFKTSDGLPVSLASLLSGFPKGPADVSENGGFQPPTKREVVNFFLEGPA